jgi:hypothetical protein
MALNVTPRVWSNGGALLVDLTGHISLFVRVSKNSACTAKNPLETQILHRMEALPSTGENRAEHDRIKIHMGLAQVV